MTVSTKTDKAAVMLLQMRLDPKKAGHSAAPCVTAALQSEDLRIYLDSWVYPVLQFLLDGETYCGQAEYIKRDAAARGVKL